MKKYIIPLLASLVLLASSTAFAQSFQSHDVEIELPGVLMIRLVNGTSNSAVTSPSPVVFDLSALDADSFDPEGTYNPTNASAFNWDDVAVFSNGGAWDVTVTLTNPGTFTWSKVAVDSASGDFTLVDDTVIADGTGRTNGWARLGFGPQNFSLDLDGTEDSGSYSVTVTYSIATP